MDTLRLLPQRLLLVAALGLVSSMACRAVSVPTLTLTPTPTTTPTTPPEILADCFWSADVFAWVDSNGDGARQEGEPPLSGVEANFNLNFLGSGTTGADGFAHISAMHPGECNLALENSLVARAPEGYTPTTDLIVPYTEDRDLYNFGFAPNPNP